MRMLAQVALVAAVSAIPAPLLAQDATGSFGVTVNVAEYCEINAPQILTAQGDGMVTGSVFESCNMQDGFQVVASHRPLEASEWVAFNYAGNVRYLKSSGWSEVANRSGAKYGERPISVSYTSLTAPLAINLTITAF
jgi:uncharacterized membrane protein